jgi:hypothetical protein
VEQRVPDLVRDGEAAAVRGIESRNLDHRSVRGLGDTTMHFRIAEQRRTNLDAERLGDQRRVDGLRRDPELLEDPACFGLDYAAPTSCSRLSLYHTDRSA